MKPKVLVNYGNGKRYELPADNKLKTIGRASDSDFHFIEKTVSRYHAEIIHEVDGQVYVQDTKSRNNTYVERKGDGNPIDVQKETKAGERVQIFIGDIVSLGEEVILRLEKINKKTEKALEDKLNSKDTQSNLGLEL